MDRLISDVFFFVKEIIDADCCLCGLNTNYEKSSLAKKEQVSFDLYEIMFA